MADIVELQKRSDEAHGMLKVSRISSVKAKPIRPLWPGFLYCGKVTVLAGIPGEAKSLSALDVVARITVGGPWPVGAGNFAAARVLLLTAEDDVADTIRPRLDLAHADCDKVEDSLKAFTTSLTRLLASAVLTSRA